MANHDKFQLLLVKQRKNKEHASLTISRYMIQSTEVIRLLGVNIDEYLIFSKHIGDLCKKASKRVGVLSRLRNLIPTEAKLLLYKTSVLPYLTYCHLIWHFCKASDSRKVERVQERALRIVFNSQSEEYSSLLKRAELPTLLNRRLQDIAILMFKVKYGMVPDSVQDIFNIKTSNYCLRNRNFYLPRFESVNYGKHSLRYLGPYIWAKLDKMDKEKPSLQSFKACIRQKDLTDLIIDNNCSSCIMCNS